MSERIHAAVLTAAGTIPGAAAVTMAVTPHTATVAPAAYAAAVLLAAGATIVLGAAHRIGTDGRRRAAAELARAEREAAAHRAMVAAAFRAANHADAVAAGIVPDSSTDDAWGVAR